MASVDLAWCTNARNLWIEGVPVPQIAQAVGHSEAQVWRRRYVELWPDRIPKGDGRQKLVAMVAKMWLDDIPRLDISLLAQISLGTLDEWKRKYGWPSRRAGLKRLWPTVDGRMETLQERHARLKEERSARKSRSERRIHAVIRYKQREAKQQLNARWRCCGWLLDSPQCPTCHRPSPLCA